MNADTLAAALGRGVRVLAFDLAGGIAALDKPAGVRSHPNGPEPDAGALLRWRYDAAAERYSAPDGPAWFALLHRLDAATSGVCLVAFDERTAVVAKRLFAERGVAKTYRAVVAGAPRGEGDVWKDRLLVERRGGSVRARVDPRGVPAETVVSVVRRVDGPWGVLADLELQPHTGRTHQLRVQAARRRLPILGDQTYGDFRLNRAVAQGTGVKRLLLHAASVSFDAPDLRFTAEAPLPAEFNRVLGG